MQKCIKSVLSLLLISTMLLSMVGCSKHSDLPEGFTRMTDKQIQETIDNYANCVIIPDNFEMQYELTLNYTVTDSDVEQGLIHALPNLVTNKTITDRPCQTGDTIHIIYSGKIDGKSFPGGSTGEAGTDMILGHAGFINGFEDNITGMNIDETKTFDITYPDSYGSSLLAGKTATFEVTLVKIFEKTLPELTDELVQANSDYKTVDEIKQACRKALEQDATMNRNTELYTSVITYTIENSTFTNLLDDEVNSYIAQFNEMLDGYASENQMDRATAIKYLYDLDDADEFDRIIREDAELYIKSKMVTYALAKKYNIELTADAFDEYRTNLVNNNGLYSVSDITAMYDDNALLYDYASGVVSEYVIEHAKEK